MATLEDIKKKYQPQIEAKNESIQEKESRLEEINNLLNGDGNSERVSYQGNYQGTDTHTISKNYDGLKDKLSKLKTLKQKARQKEKERKNRLEHCQKWTNFCDTTTPRNQTRAWGEVKRNIKSDIDATQSRISDLKSEKKTVNSTINNLSEKLAELNTEYATELENLKNELQQDERIEAEREIKKAKASPANIKAREESKRKLYMIIGAVIAIIALAFLMLKK